MPMELQHYRRKENRLLKERKINKTVDAVNIKSLDRDIKDCATYEPGTDIFCFITAPIKLQFFEQGFGKTVFL